MNTVLVVLFIIVFASFITGVCLTMWENKHDIKIVFTKEKVPANRIITNNIVISSNFIEVLEMDVESSFNDMLDAEII